MKKECYIIPLNKHDALEMLQLSQANGDVWDVGARLARQGAKALTVTVKQYNEMLGRARSAIYLGGMSSSLKDRIHGADNRIVYTASAKRPKKVKAVEITAGKVDLFGGGVFNA